MRRKARFKIETDENGLLYAVALTRFTNKALKRFVEPGEKSGYFDSPDTLEQSGTSWIFGNSCVKNSKLIGDVAVLDSSLQNTVCSGLVRIANSNISNSILEYGRFLDSKISNVEIKNDTKGKAIPNACGIVNSTVQFEKSSLCETFFIFESSVFADCCSFCDVNICKSKILGRDTDIFNTYIKGVFVGSDICISNSTICCEESKNELFSIAYDGVLVDPIIIDKANVLSSKFFRILTTKNDVLCVYKTSDSKIGSTFAVFDREKNKAVSFYDFALKNKEEFCDSIFAKWVTNQDNVKSFIDKEISILKSVFFGLSNNIHLAKEIILMDLLFIFFATKNTKLSVAKKNVSEKMRVDVAAGNVIPPDGFFVYSDALTTAIMQENFFTQKRMTAEMCKITSTNSLSVFVLA